MANMSYCRFQNTRYDMEDCLMVLRAEKHLSRDEAKAGHWMFDDILSYCRDAGVIDAYDSGMLEAIFDGFARKENDDE